MSESNKPVKHFRAGRLEIAIWENKVEIDKVMITTYTCTMKKTIKVNDEWKETNSLFTNELPIAVMLMHNAYSWIYIERKNNNN